MEFKTALLCVLMIAWVTATSGALAAGGVVKSPTGVAPERYVYYPGTEALAKDEIRLIACGTGLPAARRDQAATCWLTELGNGDKFLFDVGTGSMANVAALMIPYDFLDKVFLTHLHTDHWGQVNQQRRWRFPCLNSCLMSWNRLPWPWTWKRRMRVLIRE